MTPKKLLSSIKIIVIALILAVGIQYIYAQTNTWISAPGAPTNCPTGDPGCDAPINVSNTYQIKGGPLILNATSGSTTGLMVAGQSVFNTAGVVNSAIQIIDGHQASGSVLTSDASGNGTWQTPSTGGTSVHGEKYFTSTGTWIAPAGVTSVFVRVWGAGGGGGAVNCINGCVADGGGGGSGGYEEGVVLVTPGNPYTVTVGTGGSPGASSPRNCSSNGGESSFSNLEADGGYGGGSSCGDGTSDYGGVGGSPNEGNPIISGAYGVTGQGGRGGGYCDSPDGGTAPLGGNGGYYGAGNGPFYPENPGGGGYGGIDCSSGTNIHKPVSGADGGVVIEW
jgi:hypothetical protein